MWLPSLSTLWAAGVLSFVAPSPAMARAPGRGSLPSCTPALLTAAPDGRCPALFGDEAVRSANAATRMSALESVYRGTNTIWVTQSADWTTPTRVSLRGIDLDETAVDDGCEPIAVITIDAAAAPGCEAGSYVVRADDSLGADGRVLAVVPGALLLELDGDLRYVVAEGAREPVWRMVWHPGWRFEGRRATVPAPTPPRPRPPVPRRR